MTDVERPAAEPNAGTRLLVTLLCALESAALFGFTAFYGYEIAIGESADVARAVMSMLLILLGGIGLLLLARGWRRGGDWPRTPTIVWNLLLLPVTWSLLQAGRSAIGTSLLLIAVGSILSSIAAASSDRHSSSS